jgi:hypothetical protein
VGWAGFAAANQQAREASLPATAIPVAAAARRPLKLRRLEVAAVRSVSAVAS